VAFALGAQPIEHLRIEADAHRPLATPRRKIGFESCSGVYVSCGRKGAEARA
jgi:hypothetical protein